MSISIGSLLIEDQRALDDLGLLPEDFDEEAPRAGVSTSSDLAPAHTPSSSVIVPSFEERWSFYINGIVIKNENKNYSLFKSC